MKTKVAFNERLREAIYRSGKTQKEVAKLIGTTDVNISRWADGSRTPRIKYINRLCDALSVTPNWLFGYEEPVLKKQKIKKYCPWCGEKI